MDDQRTAMRAKQDKRVSAIRMLRSALQNAQIDKGSGKDLTEEDISRIIAKEVRQRRESIEEAEKASRNDIIEREQEGLEVVLGYMPQQLTRQEVIEEVTKIISDLNTEMPVNRGKVIGQAMQSLKGKADGKMVSEIVGDLLSK
tara:strand:+ start:3179 stop:3610 length:432 start_codon:yes stop_codon:yes gene_type:complete